MGDFPRGGSPPTQKSPASQEARRKPWQRFRNKTALEEDDVRANVLKGEGEKADLGVQAFEALSRMSPGCDLQKGDYNLATSP